MDCLDVAFDTFTQTAFRVELLPKYHIYDTLEYEEFNNYIKNNPIEGFANQPWLDDIKKWTNDKKIIKRLRVVPQNPSDYYLYETNWCYPRNIAAGEIIKFIQERKYVELSKKFEINDDFWIFDGNKVIILKYTNNFEFDEAIEINDEKIKTKYLEFFNAVEALAE